MIWILDCAVLPVELNQPLLPAHRMPDRAPGLEPAPSSILSAPFLGAHVENKSESLIVVCSESPHATHFSFHASLAVEVGVVCFYFSQVLPLG